MDGHPFCYYPENFTAFEAINNTHLRRKYRSQFPGDVELLRLDVDLGDHLSFKVHFALIMGGLAIFNHKLLSFCAVQLSQSDNNFYLSGVPL